MDNNLIADRSSKYPKLIVSQNVITEAINIKKGVYAPLTGFLRQADYRQVLDNMRLTNGSVWSLPVVVDIGYQDYKNLRRAKAVILANKNSQAYAVLVDIEVFSYDKQEFAQKIFGTLSSAHPGVEFVKKMGDYLLGGKIIEARAKNLPFADKILWPAQTKALFKQRGWQKIVAFQTRNIPHRSHEFLQKKALSYVDGIFIQPTIGEKQKGDFCDEVVIESYQLILDKYYDKNKYVFAVLPYRMRYAGPREAIIHALIRRNFGCTHFIVGRDHAGVNGIYEPYAAQKIFSQFSQSELGIEILKFSDAFYCRACGKHTQVDACPHNSSYHIRLSGTKIRQLIQAGQSLPAELVRPEVSQFLLKHKKPFV